ncbi:hypothetical protein OJF2_14310 [Aquisphaera giovannonii]|uniref:Uncharacterized protein n=2 Tax=Aquisphaera giovannonii TaxID=406548 RepID=A0A5B9VYD7_9BACT|nr:hypothetical protein OJF2_14310 [Aquisphaera giovannonii]
MAECRQGTIEARLEGLEEANRSLAAECRRWRRGGFVALAGLAVLAAAGANGLTKVLEAEQFVLRDPAGRMRAALAIRPDGSPGLGLFDEKGRPRISMDVNPTGVAGVCLLDASGHPQAALAIRPDGTPGLGLFDPDGTPRLSLDIDAVGRPAAHLHGDDGRLRAALAIRPDGTPGLGLFDEQGNPSAALESKPREARPQAAARPEPPAH